MGSKELTTKQIQQHLERAGGQRNTPAAKAALAESASNSQASVVKAPPPQTEAEQKLAQANRHAADAVEKEKLCNYYESKLPAAQATLAAKVASGAPDAESYQEHVDKFVKRRDQLRTEIDNHRTRAAQLRGEAGNPPPSAGAHGKEEDEDRKRIREQLGAQLALYRFRRGPASSGGFFDRVKGLFLEAKAELTKLLGMKLDEQGKPATADQRAAADKALRGGISAELSTLKSPLLPAATERWSGREHAAITAQSLIDLAIPKLMTDWTADDCKDGSKARAKAQKELEFIIKCCKEIKPDSTARLRISTMRNIRWVHGEIGEFADNLYDRIESRFPLTNEARLLLDFSDILVHSLNREELASPDDDYTQVNKACEEAINSLIRFAMILFKSEGLRKEQLALVISTLRGQWLEIGAGVVGQTEIAEFLAELAIAPLPVLGSVFEIYDTFNALLTYERWTHRQRKLKNAMSRLPRTPLIQFAGYSTTEIVERKVSRSTTDATLHLIATGVTLADVSGTVDKAVRVGVRIALFVAQLKELTDLHLALSDLNRCLEQKNYSDLFTSADFLGCYLPPSGKQLLDDAPYKHYYPLPAKEVSKLKAFKNVRQDLKNATRSLVGLAHPQAPASAPVTMTIRDWLVVPSDDSGTPPVPDAKGREAVGLEVLEAFEVLCHVAERCRKQLQVYAIPA